MTEPIRGHRGVAVAVASDESPVKVGHQADLVAERREPFVDRDPRRIGLGQVVGETHVDRRAGPSHDGHPERPRLSRESGPVVVRPQRCGRELGMQLPRDLSLGEGIPVGPRHPGDDDAAARERNGLNVLRQLAAG
jgi:hypothetical protein